MKAATVTHKQQKETTAHHRGINQQAHGTARDQMSTAVTAPQGLKLDDGHVDRNM
jgi:hypothetical protein